MVSPDGTQAAVLQPDGNLATGLFSNVNNGAMQTPTWTCCSGNHQSGSVLRVQVGTFRCLSLGRR